MSDVVLRGNWAAADILIRRAADALAATGQDIVDTAKEHMYPGHFLDTALSHDTALYEQLTETSGQARIPTIYAEAPEYGTPTMAPRPVVGPACAEVWPVKLHEHWEEARLGTLAPHPTPGPPIAPVSRPTGGTP